MRALIVMLVALTGLTACHDTNDVPDNTVVANDDVVVVNDTDSPVCGPNDPDREHCRPN